MAAPTFVRASTGTTDSAGAWTHTATAPDAAGNLYIVHAVTDGTNTGGATAGISSVTNAENLAGTDNVLTSLGGASAQSGGDHAVGSAAVAYQQIWLGRALNTSAMVITGVNTAGDDVYVRVYEFSNASAGTTLGTVIENAAGDAIITQGVSDGTAPIGNVATTTREAQSFTATAPISGVGLYLDKVGAPADNVLVEIQTDSAGAPSGTVLASWTLAASAITGAALYSFRTSSSLDLTTSTLYWIVAARSGALDAANYYTWATQSTNVYSGGARSRDNAGTWEGFSSDFRFTVYGISSSGAATSGTIADAAVTTLGVDRLALNLVGINDDNAVAAFTGETGGDWIEAVAEYADATGTDACIQLQTAIPHEQNSFVVGNGTSNNFGDNTNTKVAQSFTLDASQGSLVRLQMKVGRSNSPTDNLVIELQTDSGGSPSGTVLGSTTTSGAGLSTPSATLTTFTFTALLSEAGTYWIVLSRDGAQDATNNYIWEQSNVAYSGGQAKRFQSAAWQAAESFDRTFLSQVSVAGTVDGGTATNVDATDGWGVVGFALIGTTVFPSVTYQPRYSAINFQDPGVL